MACTGAANVHALALDGTFDDAQRVLKELFGEREFATRHRLSAVNSINLARILAQCVYYLHAWLRLPAEEGSGVEFVVPTGNFGNVLAGWLLARMGVPMAGLHVATNRNDILHRFFTTGEYRVGEVAPSLAPSMDIQVASNFERWLYYYLGGDPVRVRAAMTQLGKGGSFRVENLDRGLFTSSRVDDAGITATIRRVHQRYGYVVDPHTACGFAAPDSGRARVVLATPPGEIPRGDQRGDRPGGDRPDAGGAQVPAGREAPVARHGGGGARVPRSPRHRLAAPAGRLLLAGAVGRRHPGG